MTNLDIIKEERAKYPSPLYVDGRLINSLGFEKAWKICNAVALRLGLPWGLHRKDGTNWGGYAIDIIASRGTNKMYDILGNSEHEGFPQFNEVEGILNWAPPLILAEPIPEPIPPPVTDKLVSSNEKFSLSMQDDGNLVIYKNGVPIWASGTNGR